MSLLAQQGSDDDEEASQQLVGSAAIETQTGKMQTRSRRAAPQAPPTESLPSRKRRQPESELRDPASQTGNVPPAPKQAPDQRQPPKRSRLHAAESSDQEADTASPLRDASGVSLGRYRTQKRRSPEADLLDQALQTSIASADPVQTEEQPPLHKRRRVTRAASPSYNVSIPADACSLNSSRPSCLSRCHKLMQSNYITIKIVYFPSWFLKCHARCLFVMIHEQMPKTLSCVAGSSQ